MKYTIPQSVIDACRRGYPVVPLRKKPASGTLPHLDELPVRPMRLDELLAWQQKHNPPSWMIFSRGGLRFYIEDDEIWEDFCGAMGGKDNCDHFVSMVQRPGCPPIPLEAFGPSRQQP